MVADKPVQLAVEKKKRIEVYEMVDDLNDLDNKVWKRLHSKEVRDHFKKVRRKINEWAKQNTSS